MCKWGGVSVAPIVDVFTASNTVAKTWTLPFVPKEVIFYVNPTGGNNLVRFRYDIENNVRYFQNNTDTETVNHNVDSLITYSNGVLSYTALTSNYARATSAIIYNSNFDIQ